MTGLGKPKVTSLYDYTAKDSDELNLTSGDWIQKLECGARWCVGHQDGRVLFYMPSHSTKSDRKSCAEKWYYAEVTESEGDDCAPANIIKKFEVSNGWSIGLKEGRVGLYPDEFCRGRKSEIIKAQYMQYYKPEIKALVSH